MSALDSKIVQFYGGAGFDHRGRPLTEILKWSDVELERIHDYIQWLFPLQERSGFNVAAPVLDRLTIQEFQSRPDLQQNLRLSFLRMLEFYGLEFVQSNPPTVVFAPSFAERSENWLTASNHNHLRITRILKSMRTLGLHSEAVALFNCLADIYREELGKDSPAITAETFRFWRSAIKG